jgi:type IV pilus assembly protein PilE
VSAGGAEFVIIVVLCLGVLWLMLKVISVGYRRHGIVGGVAAALLVSGLISGGVLYKAQVDREVRAEWRRVDGMTSLLEMANEQEKYYLDNSKYASTLSDIWNQGSESADGHYELSTIGDDTTFRVVALARPDGKQAKDSLCQCMVYTESGVKSAYDNSSCTGTNYVEECWGAD